MKKIFIIISIFLIGVISSGCINTNQTDEKITALTAYRLLEDHLNGNDFSIFLVESMDNETFNTGKSSGWKFFGGFPLEEEAQFDYFLCCVA